MSDQIKWEDPPVVREIGKPSWGPLLAPLREHRGRWAMVKEMGSDGSAWFAAYQIRHGQRAGIEAGEYEATSRGKKVYARFVGEEER